MSDPINVDVAIIGGGIMGLWLLKDLKEQKYQAVLLDCGQLGGQQTCHSHVYIHRGHIYTKEQKQLVQGLSEANHEWAKWIEGNPDVVVSKDSYFGFESEASYEDRTQLWKKWRLGAISTDPSELEALYQGDVKYVASAKVDCLDAQQLVRALMTPWRDCIVRIKDSSLSARRLPDASGHIVEAEDTRGKPLQTRCRALVFAAGAGNRRLLKLGAREGAPAEPNLQIRKAHMLVVRGPKEYVRPLIGIFDEFGGLFVVTRAVSEQENVWLVSDNRSIHIKNAEDWIVHDPRWWVYRVLVNLQAISPRLVAGASNVRWGIYEAPKAEAAPRIPGKIPEEEHIHQCGESAWAVWPTKLTLAPLASAKLIRDYLKLGSPLSGTSDFAGYVHPEAAPETWAKVRMFEWKDFSEIYCLEDL